jgi:aconitate hydratase
VTGPLLLSAQAVTAESFERIHRSKLVGMGELPLMYGNGNTADSLGMIGDEMLNVFPHLARDGVRRDVTVQCHIDTPVEIDHYKNGGILQTVLRSILAKSKGEVKA